jgi:hypothetical protein
MLADRMKVTRLAVARSFLLARTIHEGFEVREEEQRTWGCEANQAPKQLLSNEQD